MRIKNSIFLDLHFYYYWSWFLFQLLSLFQKINIRLRKFSRWLSFYQNFISKQKSKNWNLQFTTNAWRDLMYLYFFISYFHLFEFKDHKKNLKIYLTWNLVFPSHKIADKTQKMPSHMFNGIRKTLKANLRASNFLASLTPSMRIHPDWFR